MENNMHLNISNGLLLETIELIEKFTDTKILEFSLNIVKCINHISNNVKEEKALLRCEEVLGKIWLQSINPQSKEETELFTLMHNSWSYILSCYAHYVEYKSQFKVTFYTIITCLSSLISTSEVMISNLYAKLCIAAIKELFLTPPEDFVLTELSLYLQNLCSTIEELQLPHDKFDTYFTIAINCALLLDTIPTKEVTNSFTSFRKLFDIVELEPQILETSIAGLKSIKYEQKTNTLHAALLEQLLPSLYEGIKSGKYSYVGLKLQLAVVLYKNIDSEELFGILFMLHFGFCSASFPKNTLKEVLDSLNVLLSINTKYFKTAIGKLNSKEVSCLLLLMKSHANNQIL